MTKLENDEKLPKSVINCLVTLYTNSSLIPYI